MDQTVQPTPPAPTPGIPPALLKLVGVIMLGALAVQLDATMTNVAVNTLLREFDAPLSTIQWVGTGYLLALTTMIPLTGWAADRFGTRALWTVSLAGFLVGSLLSGLAWSAGSLIAFRIVQGVGGGMLVPLAQTILAQAAGPERLGRVMAAIGIPAMLGPVLGPVLGGLIVTDLNWRWIFFVNVPVCLVGMLLARRVMPDARPAHGAPLDRLGLVLLPPGCAAVVYGLAEAGRHGRFDNLAVLVALSLGVALLAGFTLHALRTRGEPLIDLRLLTERTFTACVAVVFLSGIALFGAIILLPIYQQQVRGASPLHAGLLLAPQGVGMALGLIIAGRLTDRLGPRPIVLAGLAVAAAGTATYTQVGTNTSQLLLAAALAVSGVGMGVTIVPVLASPYRGLPKLAIPRATSAIRIFQQLGGAFGGAVLAVVVQRQLADHGPAATAAAFGATFWWVLGFTLLAVLPALLLPASRPPTQVRAGEAA
ncbi:DHA2 family efflux MFS transporter permease subunit [Micromonospora sp. NPDC048999]|uniref:DHA2 family efflux MFS transporter permease subunit n=1 Tax=Micromonospora sp. NPDC048999 TaxID=3155391 RepID=UPI0033C89C34